MSVFDRPYKRLWNTVLSTADKYFSHDKVWARPLRIHLEVNDLCNLKCPHCPRENPDIPKNTGHLPIEAVRNLAPWFGRASYVGLAGNGEPFLHPDIMEILKIVIENGATPSVISNATLWKKLGLVDQLAGIGPMLMMVSIDGGTKATFEKWRKRANFDEVRENLRLLREAKEKKDTPYPIVNFISCLMKDTLPEVEKIVDLADEAGAKVVVFQNMFPYNKLMDDNRVKDMEECRRAIQKARARAREKGIRIDWLPMSVDVDERGEVGGSEGYITSDSVDHEYAAPESNGSTPHYYCSSIMHQVHVTVRGKIKFCCFWTEGDAGDLTKDDFGDLWNGEAWKKLRRDLREGRKPKPCQNCHVLTRHNKRNILTAGVKDLKDIWRQ